MVSYGAKSVCKGMMIGLACAHDFAKLRTRTWEEGSNICFSPIACTARPFGLLSLLGQKRINTALLDGRSGIS